MWYIFYLSAILLAQLSATIDYAMLLMLLDSMILLLLLLLLHILLLTALEKRVANRAL